jgi:hypothetical protein
MLHSYHCMVFGWSFQIQIKFQKFFKKSFKTHLKPSLPLALSQPNSALPLFLQRQPIPPLLLFSFFSPQPQQAFRPTLSSAAQLSRPAFLSLSRSLAGGSHPQVIPYLRRPNPPPLTMAGHLSPASSPPSPAFRAVSSPATARIQCIGAASPPPHLLQRPPPPSHPPPPLIAGRRAPTPPRPSPFPLRPIKGQHHPLLHPHHLPAPTRARRDRSSAAAGAHRRSPDLAVDLLPCPYFCGSKAPVRSPPSPLSSGASLVFFRAPELFLGVAPASPLPPGAAARSPPLPPLLFPVASRRSILIKWLRSTQPRVNQTAYRSTLAGHRHFAKTPLQFLVSQKDPSTM